MEQREQLARLIDPDLWADYDRCVNEGIVAMNLGLYSGRASLDKTLATADSILLAGWIKPPVEEDMLAPDLNVETGPSPSRHEVEVDAFLGKLRPYLLDQQGDGYGWPVISGDELRAFSNILYALADLRFRRDVDGDQVITLHVCSRKLGRLIAVNVPHQPEHGDKAASQHADALTEVAAYLTGEASTLLKQSQRYRTGP